jgi:hypothetical protein
MMRARGISLLALVCVQCQSLHAELQKSTDGEALIEHQAPTETEVCRVLSPLSQPNEIAADDIMVGQGINAYRSILRQIAIYASVGNHDGQEILTAQLRALGVSAEAVREAIAWTKLRTCLPHSLPTNAPSPQSRSTVSPKREASR